MAVSAGWLMEFSQFLRVGLQWVLSGSLNLTGSWVPYRYPGFLLIICFVPVGVRPKAGTPYLIVDIAAFGNGDGQGLRVQRPCVEVAGATTLYLIFHGQRVEVRVYAASGL